MFDKIGNHQFHNIRPRVADCLTLTCKIHGFGRAISGASDSTSVAHGLRSTSGMTDIQPGFTRRSWLRPLASGRDRSAHGSQEDTRHPHPEQGDVTVVPGSDSGDSDCVRTVLERRPGKRQRIEMAKDEEAVQ